MCDVLLINVLITLLTIVVANLLTVSSIKSADKETSAGFSVMEIIFLASLFAVRNYFILVSKN